MIKRLIRIGNSFLHLLITNRPKIYWFSLVNEKGFSEDNFGDIITPYIVEKITKKKPIWFYYGSKYTKYFKHYIMAGSVIGVSCTKSIVWGSGIIAEEEMIKGGKFLAVRGPRTQKRLKELGFKVPTVVGDPGLLLSNFYNPSVKKKYDIGIVSHYVDFSFLDSKINEYKNVLHISLLTNNIEEVVDEILSCKKIISTSLHGLIAAHSYNIPTLWWKYSDDLAGDDIKFLDYFESVNIFDVKNNMDKTLEEVLNSDVYLIPEISIVNLLKSNLIKTFPL